MNNETAPLSPAAIRQVVRARKKGHQVSMISKAVSATKVATLVRPDGRFDLLANGQLVEVDDTAILRKVEAMATSDYPTWAV